ncbi:kynureninase [Actinospica durhamensis]|uniref:Kynureninase n=1 Tax=Actinospica durhamensis TaxID=1508375 RepID=A0A941ER93_9ACTN|nr:kynureninase [Actinospica durhamensis]MBR7836522.1 kynureninase [Actinospica durhamensis]
MTTTTETNAAGATPDASWAERAAALDAANPLAPCRERFLLPEGVTYLDGNSLGALPAAVPEAVRDGVARQWGEGLIGSWFGEQARWWELPHRLGDRVGALLGAAPEQTVVGDSTSVQIFNTLVAAARLRPGRGVLLTDAGHFPTDAYLADSVGELLGLRVERVRPQEFADAIARHGEDLAVAAFPAVDFATGERWDIPALTRAAHEVGAVAVWDLCHAAGAFPLELDAWDVDFAVGCTYKYLSGGPGAPAFVYANRRHHMQMHQPLTGWTGHAEPFAMHGTYTPAEGVGRARIGTPTILSMLALEAAIGAFDGVDLEVLRAQSLSLTGFFIECCDALLAGRGFALVTPREPERRGGQVTLRHPDAATLVPAAAARGVVGDKREPDLLRYGFNALYNTHADALRAARTLAELCEG